MRSARDRSGHIHTVESLQRLNDGGHAIPDLFCDGHECACAVRFVSRYQQNRANRIEPIDVPAYIGLIGGSEHAPGCRYDAKGKLTAIVAQSDPEFLSALEDGKRELRLLALHNGLHRFGLSGYMPPAGDGRPAQAVSKTTTDFATSERKLDSYLRTTADLVVLRALCDSDALLASELTLRLGPKRIPWNRFFFEPERFDEGWEQVRNGSAALYPLVIAGVVRSHHHPLPDAKYKSSFLNCFSLYRRTADADRIETFEVSVAHADGTWLAGFPADSEVVMFGLWKAADATVKTAPDKHDRTRTITYVTHKLTLAPRFKKQVIAVP